MSELAMGPAPACPFGQAGAWETSDAASPPLARLRRSSLLRFRCIIIWIWLSADLNSLRSNFWVLGLA